MTMFEPRQPKLGPPQVMVLLTIESLRDGWKETDIMTPERANDFLRVMQENDHLSKVSIKMERIYVPSIHTLVTS